MALIVIKLHPETPTTADEFISYLNELTITAIEFSFDNLAGDEIGQASFLPLPSLVLPDQPDDDTRIVQHWSDLPGPGEFLLRHSVATAVIEVDDVASAAEEYGTFDIKLRIERAGGTVILQQQVYYNVPVVSGDLPDPESFPELEASLYLALPAQQLNSNQAYVNLPEDVSPPNFTELFEAINAVLDAESQNAPTFGDFTPTQCRHIANEIVYGDLFPLPVPSNLEGMYTGPHESDDEIEQERLKFEAELISYHAIHNAQALRLEGFVCALSAAVFAEDASNNVTRVRFDVPTLLNNGDTAGKIKGAELVLGASGVTIDPSFMVPAEIFYAMGAIMPPTVSSEQRYQMAIHQDEERVLEALQRAIETGVVIATQASNDEPPGINDLTLPQIARRLHALGGVEGIAFSCELSPTDLEYELVQDWLDFEGNTIADFWSGILPGHAGGHLNLILCAVTQNHHDLIEAITGNGEGDLVITSVEALSNLSAADWRSFFLPLIEDENGNEEVVPRLDLLTSFIGSPEEKVAAFIRHLQRFFDVSLSIESPGVPEIERPPLLRVSPEDPIRRFIEAASFVFGSDFDSADFRDEIANIFPEDGTARNWLAQTLQTINDLWLLVDIDDASDQLRFSLMEALYSRGFTGPEGVREFSLIDFQEALRGTVAFEQATATAIHARSGLGAPVPVDTPDDVGFLPVNNDCCLVNCMPPPHLSPLGPIAYLHEMLRVSIRSTCDNPMPQPTNTIEEFELIRHPLRGRCSSPSELLVTRANLETPLPLIDLVNECLEAVTASLPALPAGPVHNTNGSELGRHTLCPLGLQSEQEDSSDEFCHDPVTLFEALPEHSTPATPVSEPGAYDILARDFSHCLLPYSQPLDINRIYLKQLGTSRFETMRTFREETSEFVLDPENPPAEFESHRWREPVSELIAAEYLGISPQTLALLFKQDIATSLPADEDQLILWEMYGFPTEEIEGENWLGIVVRIQEFLKRTCLTYCQFLELWRSDFVTFDRAAANRQDQVFPECEPCNLDDDIIVFDDPADPAEALRRLIVFIRLWRLLQSVPGAQYSLAVLRDICVELELFNADGTINPDFIRQLSALQRTRDLLHLPLFDPDDPPAANFTGIARTHLLALTDAPANMDLTGPAAHRFAWALDQVFDSLQPYAQSIYQCPLQPPHYLKLLAQNINALSRLAGFDPDSPGDTWNAEWTHILRMIEVLGKVYASQFTPVDLLFIFTADEHRAGHDPLPQQPDNEAAWRPFDFVDDLPEMSIFALRSKLLAVEVSVEEAETYTWTRIDAILRDELDYEIQAGETDFLDRFGNTFVPSLKEASGMTVAPAARRFRVSLADTVPTMSPKWNTPADGPFRYDLDAAELWTELALTNKAVTKKLSAMRQLIPSERVAVRFIYFAPREVICALGFLFPNKTEADECLIQEPDEQERIRYFQMAFARFHARCKVIAEHLAGHVVHVTSRPNDEGAALAWQLLTHLRADDNFTAPGWDTIGGGVPATRWGPPPLGGAFHALLGLVGTGLLCEYRRENGVLAWRDMQGPLDLFGTSQNAYNAPKPTVIPSLALDSSDLSVDQDKFLGIRNGYAIDPRTGEVLGGIETYTLDLSGFLLVDEPDDYTFQIDVDPDADRVLTWLVRISQGDFFYNLLVKGWKNEDGPERCSMPAKLRRGVWKVEILIKRSALEPDGPEDVCPQKFGTRLTYRGKDTGGEDVDLSRERLYLDRRDDFPIDSNDQDNFLVGPQLSVANCYEPPIWVMRRTYIRAFKALLCAWNHTLSVQPVTDSGGYELDVFLGHPVAFEAESHFRDGLNFGTYHVDCNFNALPVFDNHTDIPDPVVDQRANPSQRHQQALFRLFFEDFFDYTRIRDETSSAFKAPFVLFLHEVIEAHQDLPLHALVHAGFHEDHVAKVLTYFQGVELTREELFGFSWLSRLWQAEKWIRNLKTHFLPKDIRTLRPDLMAATDPSVDGDANLTTFYRDGCIENGEPHRYLEIKRLNNYLRERGRQALLAYLTGMDRVALPWGGFAESPKDLSELYLIDVEAGVCQKASRIEEAISSIHLFIQRARLGLEPNFGISNEFILLWDRRFASYETWLTCKRRELYPENWIDWKELKEARRTEGFRFLESELRRATLSIPVPGGLEYWPNQRPPRHPGLTTLQSREPVGIARLEPPVPPTPEGLGLLGTPERYARPSWLAALRREVQLSSTLPDPLLQDDSKSLPFWIQAAIRLGSRFIRIAAAGEPLASTSFEARHPDRETGCCVECGKPHPALVDEYYFWLLDAQYFEEIEQNADWGVVDENSVSDWHRPDRLPGLLHWQSNRMVHLLWCRIHNGELKQTRRSFEGVRVNASGNLPQLEFLGRSGDSLEFSVTNGQVPEGFSSPPGPGFRYDIATDTAVVLPEIPNFEGVPPELPESPPFPGGLPSYPYFAYHTPGAPLVPPTLFSPAVAVAGNLRSHCRFEAALKWYECYFNPLQEDLSEIWCEEEIELPEPNPTLPPAVPILGFQQPSEEQIRNRSITLHYVETFLAWGDALMRRHSPESFQHARLIFDTAAKILGEHPHVVQAVDPVDEPLTVAAFVPHDAPLNPKLLSIYDLVDDRLAMIHACLNAYRLRNGRANKHMTYWGNTLAKNEWDSIIQKCHEPNSMVDPCLDETDWCCPQSPYRFTFLMQKALELANEVRGIGAALLAAYEKGDAEFLASLRATHEQQLFNLALEIRQNQWRSADWDVQALGKSRESALTRKLYFEQLIKNGLIGDELQYQSLTGVGLGFNTAASISEGISEVMNMIPDITIGGAGVASSPVNVNELPIGTKLAFFFTTAARISNLQALINNTTASLRLTEGGWERREADWRHQKDVLELEIQQIVRQTHAAEMRRKNALLELNSQKRQIEQASEVSNFLRDKFTSHELYLWLQQETAALHYRMYELVLHCARQAERAYNFERGYTSKVFINPDIWDNLHEGLLSGERLQLALRQMEKSYLDCNVREYELTKHFSLRRDFPEAFLSLRTTGYCEIEIPEWMFDLDFPGHYLRRIKNVTLTLPAVVGPYTGIHCRFTLLSSATRVTPVLIDPPAGCCNGVKHVNAYEAIPDDPRIVKLYGAKEAIATSSGQNDAGMFEVRFGDERYLPFEYLGAVNCSRIEIPPENNQFDLDALSDLIIHLNYTAREGGDVLRQAANEVAQRNLPGGGLQFLDVKREHPNAWHHFKTGLADSGSPTELNLQIDRKIFPYLFGNKKIFIEGISIFFEAPGADPSAHRVVELWVDEEGKPVRDESRKCDVYTIHCIATESIPGFFHGVLEIELGPISEESALDFGALRFAPEINEVSEIFLIISYKAV